MKAWRASLLHCLADPGENSDPTAWEYVDDGLLVVDEGRIVAAGDAEALLQTLPAGVEIVDSRGMLIVPGLIDCHVHFPQLDIIGSYGAQLLDWLNQYAYPAEMRFADPEHAREVARVFVDELLRNGTTTALVFGTVHAHSADAIFEAAEAKGMRLIAGKVLCYAQGFGMIAAAGAAFGDPLPLPTVARIWRAGCIIRSALLDDIAAAIHACCAKDGASVLQYSTTEGDPELRAAIAARMNRLRGTSAAT